MKKSKTARLTIEQRTALNGHLYVLPFYIGFIFFFLTPIIKSISYVFCNVSFDVTGVLTEFTGLENLKYIFNKDLDFKGNLVTSVTALLWKTPVILILSLLLAMIANINMPGKGVIRSVFFLPVILSSGVVLDTIREDDIAGLMMRGSVVSANGSVVSSNSLANMLEQAGLSISIVNLFINISNNIFDLLFNCGIPMLIFLSGLQGISPSLYEASSVEGATAWDNFWKITLPMIMPVALINLVYIIVDNFASSSNLVMQQVLASVELLKLGEASAMVWFFCVIIAVIFAVFFAIANKFKIFEAN